MPEDNFTTYAVIPMDNPVAQALSNLRASVQGSGYGKDYGLRGNVSTYIPTGQDSGVEVGVSGMANKFGNYKNIAPTGVNASYTSGPDTFAVEFNKLSPQQQELMLNYIRQF